MSGGEAVAFFGRSGLAQSALAQVWNHADADEVGFLTPDKFYAAMRLVGLAQSLHGVALTESLARPVINDDVEAPTPRLEGVDVPSLRAAAAGAAAEWRVKPSDSAAYDALFNDLDIDSDGRVSGAEMVPIMMRWGQPQEVNKAVWDLADADADGFLDRHGVAVALTLLEGVKRGRALPTVLPPSLAQGDVSPNVPSSRAAEFGTAAFGTAAAPPPAAGAFAADFGSAQPQSVSASSGAFAADLGAPQPEGAEASASAAPFAVDFGLGATEEPAARAAAPASSSKPLPDAFGDFGVFGKESGDSGGGGGGGAIPNGASPADSAVALTAGQAGVAAAESEMAALSAAAKSAAASNDGSVEAIGARIRSLAAQLDELHAMLGLGRLVEVPAPPTPLFDGPGFTLKLKDNGSTRTNGSISAPAGATRAVKLAVPAPSGEGAGGTGRNASPSVENAFAGLSFGDAFGGGSATKASSEAPSSLGGSFGALAPSGAFEEPQPPSKSSSAEAATPPAAGGQGAAAFDAFGAGAPVSSTADFDAPPGGGAPDASASAGGGGGADDPFAAFGNDAFGAAPASFGASFS